jgi:glycogen debranching enzyme
MANLGPLSEVLCVRGGAFVMSSATGDIVPGGDQGYYDRDTRFLNRLELLVDDRPPIHLAAVSTGGDSALFHACLQPQRPDEIDPVVSVVRRRVVDGGLRDEITFRNASARPVELRVAVRAGTDFAYVQEVKHGKLLPEVGPTACATAIRLSRPDGDEWTRVVMTDGAADSGVLTATVRLPARGQSMIVVEAQASTSHGAAAPRTPRVRAPGGSGVASRATTRTTVDCSDGRLRRLVDRSLRDLASLDQRDPESPVDRYAAAGSPWFLTLFGRDAIWTAFMALPFDPELARGTLRVLARRQGRLTDPVSEEQPGKIVHEVRHGALSSRGDLPDRYFGSVDATPLFVVLAHEAWRWGMADADVAALLPNVEAALGWMRDSGDVDGDGFLEYSGPDRDAGGPEHGLANQGWKDSGDGIRFADGSLAGAPIALAEVQGYAYDAARRGAELLDHFARPGGDAWRRWAAEVRRRFREEFWVEDAIGPYPAIALDEQNRPVDGPASNMGHLLMSGILDGTEAAHVAQRLAHPSLASGWGLRTLASTSGGFNPLSYHCGSVWPHDTAIAVWGLARTGRSAEALHLVEGLVNAAPWFDYRLPELFSGFAAEDTVTPVPYPAACRPQAWASASALLVLRALLGIEVDVPGGGLTLRPLAPLPCERIVLTGLRVADGTVDISARSGTVSVEVHDTDVRVEIEAPR